MPTQRVHRKHVNDQHSSRVGETLTLENVSHIIKRYRLAYQDEINKFYGLCQDELINNLLAELGDNVLKEFNNVGIVKELFGKFDWLDPEEFERKVIDKLIKKLSNNLEVENLNFEEFKKLYLELLKFQDSKWVKQAYLKELENQDSEQVKEEKLKYFSSKDFEEFKKEKFEKFNDLNPKDFLERGDLKYWEDKDPKEFKREFLKYLQKQDPELFKLEYLKELNSLDPKEFEKRLLKIGVKDLPQAKHKHNVLDLMFFKQLSKKFNEIDSQDLINIFILKYVEIGKQILDLIKHELSEKLVLNSLLSKEILEKIILDDIIWEVIEWENEQPLIELINLIKSKSTNNDLTPNLYKAVRKYVLKVEHELSQEFKNLDSFHDLLMVSSTDRTLINEIKIKEALSVLLNYPQFAGEQFKPIVNSLKRYKGSKMLTEDEENYAITTIETGRDTSSLSRIVKIVKIVIFFFLIILIILLLIY